jgi:hypothetical protein
MDSIEVLAILAVVVVAAVTAFALAARGGARMALEPPSLFSRMRQHLGLKTSALGAAPGGAAQVADAIERCGRCTHPAECRAWLEADRDARAPGFCANAELLENLRRDPDTAKAGV